MKCLFFLIALLLIGPKGFAASSEAISCDGGGMSVRMQQTPALKLGDLPKILLGVRDSSTANDPTLYTSLVGADERLIATFGRQGDYVDFVALRSHEMVTLKVIDPGTLQMSGHYSAILRCRLLQK
jgi:hypothetical protein